MAYSIRQIPFVLVQRRIWVVKDIILIKDDRRPKTIIPHRPESLVKEGHFEVPIVVDGP